MLVLPTEHCVVVELDVEQVLDVIPEATIHALALDGDAFFCYCTIKKETKTTPFGAQR